MNKKVIYIDTCHDVAGGQRSLIALLVNVCRLVDFSVLIEQDNKKYEKELLDAGVPQKNIIKFNSKPFGVRLLGGVSLFLKSIALARRYDIAHCNTFFDGLFSMPAFRIMGKKTVFRARCGVDLSNHGGIDKIIYSSANMILSNSEYVKSTFSRVSKDLSKIKTVYNPLDMKFSDKVQQVEDLNPGKYIIAVIGAITEVKNQVEVLQAFTKLNDDNLILRFIGEPRSTEKDRLYYKRLIDIVKENKLENKVEFTGFISDVRTKLNDVNLVCVPSDREPLGRVIFESQLYGIPVLASRSGGNTELIDDGVTGLLYTLGDVDELAKKIEPLH